MNGNVYEYFEGIIQGIHWTHILRVSIFLRGSDHSGAPRIYITCDSIFFKGLMPYRYLYLPLPYLKSIGTIMHSTISLILFFQWCSKSTPVSLSSERILQLLWEFSWDRDRQALFLHPLQAGKFQFANNIKRPVGIRNHTPQACGVADKCH